jgi:hypothetical protein
MDKNDLKQRIAEYAINKDLFPEDFKASVERFFEMAGFFYEVFDAMSKACDAKLRALATRHYPDLAVVHPIIEEYLHEVNTGIVQGIVYGMRGLVNDMKEGVDFHEKYPKLEEWRSYYCHPKPKITTDKDRYSWDPVDDAEWEKEKHQQNRELYRLFCWEEHRKTEFYEIVQPELFKVYPVLNELEGDAWVLYAVNLRDEYENWLTIMESTESAVQYEMPPECVHWDSEKYWAEKSARYKQYGSRSDKRIAMINSFPIPDDYKAE